MILRTLSQRPNVLLQNTTTYLSYCNGPQIFRARALDPWIDGHGSIRLCLSANVLSAIAGFTLVVEAAVRPTNGGAAAALHFGTGSCERHDSDWWIHWWLADCVVWRQV
jgi:hypothetical protein